MAHEDFVRFYEEFVPGDEVARERLDATESKEDCLATAVELGRGAGFDFSPEEAGEVLDASEKKLVGWTVDIRVDEFRKAQRRGEEELAKGLRDKFASTTGCCW
jgi:hypothetical protein